MWLIKTITVTALTTFFIVSSITVVIISGVRAGDRWGQRAQGAVKIAEDFDNADLERIQHDDRSAPLEVAQELAKAAMGAQTIASPGISKNPIPLDLTEAISVGQMATQAVENNVNPPTGQTAQSAEQHDSQQQDESAQDSSSDINTSDSANAPSTHHIAWYTEIDGERYLMVTPVSSFNDPDVLRDVGIWEFKNVHPVALTAASESSGDVIQSVINSVTEWNTHTTTPYAVIGGVKYNLEYSSYLFTEYLYDRPE